MPEKLFSLLVYISAESPVVQAIAASRHGHIGIINAELSINIESLLQSLEIISHPLRGAKAPYGIKLGNLSKTECSLLASHLTVDCAYLIADTCHIHHALELAKLLTHTPVVLAEHSSRDIPECVKKKQVDGIILKGNESGGFVGEESSYILVQHWLKHTDLPLYVRGGLTPHTAAACARLGVKGGVLDSQLLLLNDSPVQDALQKLIAPLSGSETIAVGDGEKEQYFRVLSRPQLKETIRFIAEAESASGETLHEMVARFPIRWHQPIDGLLPVGQDICFAEAYRKQYGTLPHLLDAFDRAVSTYPHTPASLTENNPLAQALGIRYPIVQGPMTRVSDTASFANAVAENGGLPMLAFALMRPTQITTLLEETKTLMGHKPWGIGLLGFVPTALLNEQIAAALPFKPHYAIIAGGRPDQAVALEKQGIPSFLHLPSANLLENFLKQGARRFIFEGRECGGHIGPLSSFTLWSTMIDRLVQVVDEQGIPAADIQCLFAGGIHDELSSALLQTMLSPLAQRGVKLGIIMGSAYLFTKEIVENGAIVNEFQDTVLACTHTVNLESGPGHASRCAYTPFAESFFTQRNEWKATGLPADELREKLDGLILGTLRIAAKGVTRNGDNITPVPTKEQQQSGMYMLGQLVALRNEKTTIAELHEQVTTGAANLLANLPAIATEEITSHAADIAIVGIECALPGAKNTRQYWENILNSVDAIGEIPAHRWDWQLYFDADRHAKDKIYSRWGGFMDDMPFDPARYGITPKSIESVDPMQLMTLEVARAALDDAGFDHHNAAIRARTSVILGASGGAGDVGMQYGVRSELPRFLGELPQGLGNNLPEWSEDTFAGILINVVAGRIANRLNLGGVNYTTDAACASSLSAVYQAVNELQGGQCDVAVAGGSDTVQGAFGYMCFSQTQALSPTGRCRTFDASSDGIVISEGIVILVLKRLSDAERDGNRIYAVIKGIGGGSDGKAKGLSAPLPEGQLRAMHRAYAQAGVSPESITLFEAHGTGTVAGDTAELQSTTALVKQAGARPHHAMIGSVKTMIGHTKATAGVAGMAKAALALYHKILPPHRGVQQPNPVFLDPACPFYLIDQPHPWIHSNENPRRAAVSAFGFGGTNFHAVLEEYQGEYRAQADNALEQWPAELFIFTGNDVAALQSALQTTSQLLASQPDIYLRDLAYALANAAQGSHRLAIVASNFGQLAEQLAAALAHVTQGTALPKTIYYDHAGTPATLAVLFPGQGSQYTGMLRELATYFPAVSDSLSAADTQLHTAFTSRFGKALSQFIYPRASYDAASRKAAESDLTRTDITQPALGSVECGVWQLLQSFGLKPAMAAGHSYGEFVALYAAGKLSFTELMAVSEARGRLIVDHAKKAGGELGTMAAIKASRSDVERVISGTPDLVIANHNAPEQIIISGTHEAIGKACQLLTEHHIKSVPIHVAAAFHSPCVEPARAAFAEVLRHINWQEGNGIVAYSNTTASPHQQETLAQTMADHLTSSVEFVRQVETMYADGARVFLEVGPKPVLSRLVGQILRDKPHTAVALDDHSGGITGLLHTLGQLFCAGVALDVKPLFAGRDCLSLKFEQLAEAKRTAIIPKHAWMLNGSRARRVSDPVKTVGVTKGQTVAVTPTPTAPRTAPKNLSFNQPRKTMKDPNYHGSVTQAYFDLVAEQLNNARDVALAELGIVPDMQSITRAAPATPRNNRNVTPLPVRSAPAPRPVAVPTAAAPAPMVAAPVAPAPAAAKPTAQKPVKDIILSIVTEKTGYEADMIAFNQNLEADLGVDSIKRVDIVGSILDALPDAVKQNLGDEGRTKLNTAKTLQNMLDILQAAGGASSNFNSAGAGTNEEGAVASSFLPRLDESRFVMVAKPDEVPANAAYGLTPGTFIITEDSHGIASLLADKITQNGQRVLLLPGTEIGQHDTLTQWCQQHDVDQLAGIIHLAALDAATLDATSDKSLWQSQLFRNEKSFFALLHHYRLQENAHVVAASNLGGTFSRRKAKGLSLQGGAVGLLKSLVKEQQALRGKAIDLDPTQSPQAQAEQIFSELSLQGGRLEVGYPSGIRTVFLTEPAPVTTIQPLSTPQVVLATGGSRGVTAETLRDLAKPGNTLILTGRSPLPTIEQAGWNTEELRTLTDEKSLVRHLVKSQSLDLGKARQQAGKILAAREMLDNIADFEKHGATVAYYAVDVTDESAMAALITDVIKTHGTITGIVHGAGIIEDKYLKDITPESWSRVVETKVIGLLLLQKYVPFTSLQWCTVFSSVAGRYGNSGQSNYATANELMNRLCCQLQAAWPNVTIRATCWGPWGKTQFGEGMVTEATEAKFKKQGVYLVHASLGRELFTTAASGNAVEIICGKAPWEEVEAEKGRIQTQGNLSLIGDKKPQLQPNGTLILEFMLHRNMPYLQDHIIDAHPVLPMAVALEMMAAATSRAWEGQWKLSHIENAQLFKGVIVEHDTHPLRITLTPVAHGMEGTMRVKAKITAEDGTPHYGATLEMATAYAPAEKDIPALPTTASPVRAEEAYAQWLFHGPVFQVIDTLGHFSEKGAVCAVHSSTPTQFTGQSEGAWQFDPALVDAAAHMSVLFKSYFREAFALPVAFERITRYADRLPAALTMHYIVTNETPEALTVDCYFTDSTGQLVLKIEGMQHIVSQTHKVIRKGTAATEKHGRA